MPGKRYTQHYHFSIVIHNVQDDILKPKLVRLVTDLEPDWSLIAQEAYNHDALGEHLHVFLKYNKKKSWKMVLDFFKKHSAGHIGEGKIDLPGGGQGTLGHIKVKVGKGDFNECKKYLTNPDKIKKLDDNISENVRHLTLIERFPQAARKCPGCHQKYHDPEEDFFGTQVIMGECHKCYTKNYNKRFPLQLPSGEVT